MVFLYPKKQPELIEVPVVIEIIRSLFDKQKGFLLY